jgi:hypothetical protein
MCDEFAGRGRSYLRLANERRRAKMAALKAQDMARHPHVVRRREWRAASVAGEAYLRRGGPLDDAEEAGYLAAGVLPYCTRVLRGRSGRAICVLLAIGMAVVRRRAEKKMEVHDSHRQKRFPPAEKETERLGLVGCGSKCV